MKNNAKVIITITAIIMWFMLFKLILFLQVFFPAYFHSCLRYTKENKMCLTVFCYPIFSLLVILVLVIAEFEVNFHPLSANPQKWSCTLKEFVGFCRRIVWVCLTILFGVGALRVKLIFFFLQLLFFVNYESDIYLNRKCLAHTNVVIT